MNDSSANNSRGIDSSLLLTLAAKHGVPLDVATAERMVAYGDALLLANRQINLTAITDATEFVAKHLLDSLVAAVQREVRGRVADVGTGGGLPGVVVKLSIPETDLTLIDSRAKKLDVVASICRGLSIPVTTAHGRAEELALGELRERFDTVTARGLAAMPQLLEYCLPLLAVGGHLLAMKGPRAKAEIEQAQRAERLLKATLIRTVEYSLPCVDMRVIAIYKKTAPTPLHYPRASKLIAARPL